MIPENTAYLWLGLVIVAMCIAAQVSGMFWRYHNAQRDLRLLDQLEAEE
jgi:hypothetical protein